MQDAAHFGFLRWFLHPGAVLPRTLPSDAISIGMLPLVVFASGLVLPTPPMAAQQLSVVAAHPAPQVQGVVFPGMLVADAEVSAAKAKIEAAKAAAAAKLESRGYEAPETKESKISFGKGAAKEEDKVAQLLADAKELKEKRLALTESGKPLSKSQSALVAQYKMMEKQAKGKAAAEKEREAERAAILAAPPPSFEIKLPFS